MLPSILSLLGCLFGGPLIGSALAAAFAEASPVAEIVSFLAFPFAMFAGLWLWFGVGLVSAIAGGLRSLLRGKLPSPPERPESSVEIPPGTGAFVVCSGSFATIAGIVTAFLSVTPFPIVMLAYLAAGLVYGWILRTLADRGYLPFPEPE